MPLSTAPTMTSSTTSKLTAKLGKTPMNPIQLYSSKLLDLYNFSFAPSNGLPPLNDNSLLNTEVNIPLTPQLFQKLLSISNLQRPHHRIFPKRFQVL